MPRRDYKLEIATLIAILTSPKDSSTGCFIKTVERTEVKPATYIDPIHLVEIQAC